MPRWTKEKMVALAAIVRRPTGMTEASKIIVPLLDMVAERNGTWVTFEELTARTGQTSTEVSHAIGALDNTIPRVFEDDDTYSKGDPPPPVEFDPPTNRSGAGVRYRMAPELAQWWREASDAVGGSFGSPPSRS